MAPARPESLAARPDGANNTIASYTERGLVHARGCTQAHCEQALLRAARQRGADGVINAHYGGGLHCEVYAYGTAICYRGTPPATPQPPRGSPLHLLARLLGRPV